jgi:hypothetical protein
MREFTLSPEPQLLRMAIEPTERLPISIDLAARLDAAEVLLSAAANDNGRNIASNVSVDGTVVTLDVGGLANGSVSLIYITAAGSAGSALRFVLLLRSIDPADRVAEEVIDPTTVLTWRGAYLAGSVYAYLDVVTADSTTWIALLDAPTAAPGVVEGEWQALAVGSPNNLVYAGDISGVNIVSQALPALDYDEKFTVIFSAPTSPAGVVGLRFNGNAGGVYNAPSFGATSISISGSVNSGLCAGRFDVIRDKRIGYHFVIVNGIADNGGSSSAVNITGAYRVNEALTSLEIFAVNNFTANSYLQIFKGKIL